MSDASKFSRRQFLKVTSVAAGTAAISATALPVSAASHGGKTNGDEASSNVRGKMFFTNQLQFQTLSQAAERIFPKDELGPGAIELGVPYFIDNQLAAAYGFNAREYNAGPFGEGAPTQGQQTALLRKDVILQGLAALNKQANEQYKKDFPDITDAQKDEILKLCAAGKIPAEGFKSSYFFSVLKEMVMGGVYADPIYNGNNNKDGWRMKEYPGHQMSYLDVVDSKKFEIIDPMSLADMQ